MALFWKPIVFLFTAIGFMAFLWSIPTAHFTNTNMARPKGRNGKPVKFYINPALKSDGAKLATHRNLSLSQLVSELLRREVSKPASRAIIEKRAA